MYAMEDSSVATMARNTEMLALDSTAMQVHSLRLGISPRLLSKWLGLTRNEYVYISFGRDDFDTQDAASDIGVSDGSDTDEEDISERRKRQEEEDYGAMINAVGVVVVNATTLDEDINGT
jgi:hypothetical protein